MSGETFAAVELQVLYHNFAEQALLSMTTREFLFMIVLMSREEAC